MDSESSRLELLRKVAAGQGVDPTDEDLRAVLGFLDAIEPELARLQELLAPEPDE